MAKKADPSADSAAAEADLTVEQLAYETGMSVRNIRNHQSRGLLPPPEVRARVGYYGPDHVARLRLIQEMQAEGFKLSAISRLIGEHGADADRFVGLRQAITAPFATEAPEVYAREELAEKFGTDDDKLIEKAKKLGLLVEIGDERYEAPSPALLRAAEEVLAMGIELPAALAAIEKLSRNAQSSARTFVELFVDKVWKPFDDAGRPEEGWEEIIESIEPPPPPRLRRPKRHLPPHPHRRNRESLRRSARTATEEEVDQPVSLTIRVVRVMNPPRMPTIAPITPSTVQTTRSFVTLWPSIRAAVVVRAVRRDSSNASASKTSLSDGATRPFGCFGVTILAIR